ncbi:MAG: MFS transporter [Erysipelotrichaceae bacterium]
MRNKMKACLFYASTYLTFCFPYAYLQTYLESVGYDVVQRGVMFSTAALITIALQFIVGYLCDKYKTNRRFYNLLLLLFVVISLFMYNYSEQVFFLHLVFSSFITALFRTGMSIQDAWTLEISEDCNTNFSMIRAFGAVGWMIGTPIAAYVVNQFGYGYLAYAFAGLAVINIIISMIVPDAEKPSDVVITMKDVKKLVSHKEFVIVTIIFLFINIIFTADNYTTVDKMLALGASEQLVGYKWSLQALMELPLFFAGAFLLKKFGNSKLLLFGTLMYIIRFIGYSLVQTPEMMIGISLLQGVTFPLIMITSKTMVDQCTPAGLKSTGQSIASGVYIGLSLLITPAIAGYLISVTSIDFTLLMIAALGVIPIILTLYLKKYKGV